MSSASRLLIIGTVLIGVFGCHQPPPLVNHAPEVPSRPTAMDFAYLYDTTRATVVAHDPDGDSMACQFAWGEAESSFSSFSVGTDSFRSERVWTTAGVRRLRVRAIDMHGEFSVWSDSTTISVGNRPPIVESLIGPDTGETGASVALRVRSRDPEGTTIACQIEWGDGDTTDWSNDLQSGTIWQAAHRWISGGSHSIRARARDLQGVTSDWSPPRTIDVRGPILAWRYKTRSRVRGGAAIGSDRTIYFASNDRYLYALNPDGTLRWRADADDEGNGLTTIGPNGTIYHPTTGRGLWARNPDGTRRWLLRISFTFSNKLQAVALGLDGTIHCSSTHLIAVNPDSTLKWEYKSAGRPRSSAVVAADGTVYFVAEDGFLTALAPDTILRWRHQVAEEDEYVAPPSIGADGTVYCCGFGELHAFAADGSPRWNCVLSDSNSHSPMQPLIASDGTIYASDGAHLHAVGSGGEVRWTVPIPTSTPAWGAIAADGTIYFVGRDSPLYALNPDGSTKWRYWTESDIRTPPTIGSDGTVYFGCDDEYFYALRGSSPLASSPWPKFQHDLQNTGRAEGR